MLKTPSRKKAATAKATKTRAGPQKKQAASSSDPFNDQADKENAAIQALPVSAKTTKADLTESSDASDGEGKAGPVRSTRSKPDKDALVKLPNPFQAKLQQVKSKSAKAASAATSATESVVDEQTRPASPHTPQEPQQDKETTATAAPSEVAKSAPAKKLTKAQQKKAALLESKAQAATQRQSSNAGSQTPADDSMVIDEFVVQVPRNRPPQTSTPLGKRATGRTVSKKMEEGLAPIADASLSVVDGGEEEEDDDDDGKSTRGDVFSELGETTAEQTFLAGKQSDPAEASKLPLSNGVTDEPPRQKRTLASFGGPKKSLGYNLQGLPTSTPAPALANTGFKSSFLNKSLRKPSGVRPPGAGHSEEDDEVEADDSMAGSGSTRANTQANAGPSLGARSTLGSSTGSQPATVRQQDASSNKKRQSDEMEATEADLPSKQARTAPSSTDSTSRPVSRAAQVASSTASSSKVPLPSTAASNLRTKLESARLQKSNTASAASRGLSSPALGRGLLSPPGSPLFEPGKSSRAAAAPLSRANSNTSPAKGSTTVSSLRNQWEAKTSIGSRTSPRKSRTSATTATTSPKRSPTKLPMPVAGSSTTPLSSPKKAAPTATLGSRNATASSSVKKTEKKPATKADPASLPSSPLEEEPAASPSETAVTAIEEPLVSQKPKGVSTNEHDDDVSTHSEGSSSDEADDEDDDEAGEGRTTKIMRPLSGPSQQASAMSNPKTAAITGTRTAEEQEMVDSSNESGPVSDGEFTLEELDGQTAAKTASASSKAPSMAKPNVGIARADNAASTAAASANGGWTKSFRSLFGIGNTGPGSASTAPAPGSGFRPTMNRSISSASQQSQSATVRTSLAASQGNLTSAKPASVIRGEQLRRKEAEEAERRAREKEEQRKRLLASRTVTQPAKGPDGMQKRIREEEERTGTSVASGSQQQATQHQPQPARPLQGSSTAALSAQAKAKVGSQYAAGSTSSQSTIKAKAAVQSGIDENGKKRRLSPEKEDGLAAKPSGTNGTIKPAAPLKQMSTTNAASSQPPRPASAMKTAPPRPAQQQSTIARPATATGNFSTQNPFQQVQKIGQQQHSQQMPRPPIASSMAPKAHSQAAAGPPASAPGSPYVNGDDMSLPSIVSEYSDSEDEATQARRARAAPWTKGDRLQRQLQEQSQMDADLIFGIPQGTVDLDALMPPRNAAARERIMRPRTSSANWNSADGLAQWEIDRYNQRMNIQGPGYRLPAVSTAGPSSRPGSAMGSVNGRQASNGSMSGVGASGNGSASGRLGPAGQEARRSVLAIGAAAAARQQQQGSR